MQAFKKHKRIIISYKNLQERFHFPLIYLLLTREISWHEVGIFARGVRSMIMRYQIKPTCCEVVLYIMACFICFEWPDLCRSIVLEKL
jgi:hypothetical protein